MSKIDSLGPHGPIIPDDIHISRIEKPINVQETPEGWPPPHSIPFKVLNPRIVDDIMVMTVTYVGDPEATIEAFTPGKIYETFPPQADLWLSVKNEGAPHQQRVQREVRINLREHLCFQGDAAINVLHRPGHHSEPQRLCQVSRKHPPVMCSSGLQPVHVSDPAKECGESRWFAIKHADLKPGEINLEIESGRGPGLQVICGPEADHTGAPIHLYLTLPPSEDPVAQDIVTTKETIDLTGFDPTADYHLYYRNSEGKIELLKVLHHNDENLKPLLHDVRV